MRAFVTRRLLDYWTRRAEREIHRNRDAAVRFLNRALALDPANARLLSLRAQAKGPGDGDADHEAALALAPGDPTIFSRRAVALARHAEREGIRRRIGPSARLEMITEAAACCSAALALDPHDQHARYLRGACRIEMDDLQGALADLSELAGLAPQNTLYVQRLGAIQARRGAYSEAIAHLSHALDLDADCQHAQATRALCRLRLGDLSGAKRDAEEALARDPHDELAFAVCAVLEGDPDDIAGELVCRGL